jgi:hypothetical protein
MEGGRIPDVDTLGGARDASQGWGIHGNPATGLVKPIHSTSSIHSYSEVVFPSPESFQFGKTFFSPLSLHPGKKGEEVSEKGENATERIRRL